MSRTFKQRISDRHESDIEKLWPEAKKTLASGAKHEKGDVKTAEIHNIEFCIECKATQNKSYSITKEVWETIKQHAMDKSYTARPVLAVRLYGPTKVEESWGTREVSPESLTVEQDLVIMDLNDFLEFYEEYLELKEKQNEKPLS